MESPGRGGPSWVSIAATPGRLPTPPLSHGQARSRSASLADDLASGVGAAGIYLPRSRSGTGLGSSSPYGMGIAEGLNRILTSPHDDMSPRQWSFQPSPPASPVHIVAAGSARGVGGRAGGVGGGMAQPTAMKAGLGGAAALPVNAALQSTGGQRGASLAVISEVTSGGETGRGPPRAESLSPGMAWVDPTIADGDDKDSLDGAGGPMPAERLSPADGPPAAMRSPHFVRRVEGRYRTTQPGGGVESSPASTFAKTQTPGILRLPQGGPGRSNAGRGGRDHRAIGEGDGLLHPGGVEAATPRSSVVPSTVLASAASAQVFIPGMSALAYGPPAGMEGLLVDPQVAYAIAAQYSAQQQFAMLQMQHAMAAQHHHNMMMHAAMAHAQLAAGLLPPVMGVQAGQAALPPVVPVRPLSPDAEAFQPPAPPPPSLRPQTGHVEAVRKVTPPLPAPVSARSEAAAARPVPAPSLEKQGAAAPWAAPLAECMAACNAWQSCKALGLMRAVLQLGETGAVTETARAARADPALWHHLFRALSDAHASGSPPPADLDSLLLMACQSVPVSVRENMILRSLGLAAECGANALVDVLQGKARALLGLPAGGVNHASAGGAAMRSWYRVLERGTTLLARGAAGIAGLEGGAPWTEDMFARALRVLSDASAPGLLCAPANASEYYGLDVASLGDGSVPPKPAARPGAELVTSFLQRWSPADAVGEAAAKCGGLTYPAAPLALARALDALFPAVPTAWLDAVRAADVAVTRAACTALGVLLGPALRAAALLAPPGVLLPCTPPSAGLQLDEWAALRLLAAPARGTAPVASEGSAARREAFAVLRAFGDAVLGCGSHGSPLADIALVSLLAAPASRGSAHGGVGQSRVALEEAGAAVRAATWAALVGSVVVRLSSAIALTDGTPVAGAEAASASLHAAVGVCETTATRLAARAEECLNAAEETCDGTHAQRWRIRSLRLRTCLHSSVMWDGWDAPPPSSPGQHEALLSACLAAANPSLHPFALLEMARFGEGMGGKGSLEVAKARYVAAADSLGDAADGRSNTRTSAPGSNGRVSLSAPAASRSARSSALDWKVWSAAAFGCLRCGAPGAALAVAGRALAAMPESGRLWAAAAQVQLFCPGELLSVCTGGPSLPPPSSPVAALARVAAVLAAAIRAVPRSGEVWVEVGRLHANPLAALLPRTMLSSGRADGGGNTLFDLAHAAACCARARALTGQYGDGYVEGIRLVLIRAALAGGVDGPSTSAVRLLEAAAVSSDPDFGACWSEACAWPAWGGGRDRALDVVPRLTRLVKEEVGARGVREAYAAAGVITAASSVAATAALLVAVEAATAARSASCPSLSPTARFSAALPRAVELACGAVPLYMRPGRDRLQVVYGGDAIF
jgi:hypothetical protein